MNHVAPFYTQNRSLRNQPSNSAELAQTVFGKNILPNELIPSIAKETNSDLFHVYLSHKHLNLEPNI